MTGNQEQQSTAELQVQNEEQQLFISGRIWHELYPKADPGLFIALSTMRLLRLMSRLFLKIPSGILGIYLKVQLTVDLPSVHS